MGQIWPWATVCSTRGAKDKVFSTLVIRMASVSLLSGTTLSENTKSQGSYLICLRWVLFLELVVISPPIILTVCTMRLWHSSHQEMGTIFPNFSSGKNYDCSMVTLCDFWGKKNFKWYSFYLVLLGYLTLQPRHCFEEACVTLWRGPHGEKLAVSTELQVMWIKHLGSGSSNSRQASPTRRHIDETFLLSTTTMK